MENPYAPPASESAEAGTVTLYSPGHIAWATFLGAPIAGCILLALNYRRLGNSNASNLALFLGLIGTVLLLAVALFLPDNFPNFVLPAAYTVGIYYFVKSQQGEAFQLRLADGGIKGSAWAATGIGILCLVVIFVLMCAVILVVPDGWISE